MKRLWILIAAIIAVAAAGTFFYLNAHNRKNGRFLYVNGRIEGDEIDVGTKVPGKIVKVLVDEGDSVRKGQILAVLDSKELRAKLKQAESNLKAAQAAASAKSQEVEFYKKKLSALEQKKSELSGTLAAELKIAKLEESAAEQELKAAEGKLEEANAALYKAKNDFNRAKKLYAEGVIPKKDYDAAYAAYRASEAKVKQSEALVKKAQDALKASFEKEKIVKEKYKQIKALSDEIDALRKTVKAKEREYKAYLDKVGVAEGAVEQVKALLEDTVIKAPADGTVIDKLINVGEVIPAGYRLFTIINLDKLYLDGYIPETKLALVHLGQPAFIKVDTYPKKKFKAYVSYVSQQAEFTPKEVQTKEERVKEVFEIKLRLKENPKHELKPGMPADGYVELGK